MALGAPAPKAVTVVGITAYAGYVPRLRLARTRIADAWGTAQMAGEIAVANYDEDALTMATEAALGCLPSDAGGVDGVYFASTSAPYREKQVAGVIATACDVSRRSQTSDFTGSVRCGVSAILAASNAVRAGMLQDVVVTAADVRVAPPDSEVEGLFGDAAAAVRIGRGDVIAELVGAAFVSEEFTHLWRTDDEPFVQAFPGKFSTTFGYARDLGEAIRTLMQAHAVEPAAVARLALYAPDARAAADLAKELGFDPRRQLVPSPLAEVGSAGSAEALLALGRALDEAAPGDLIIVGSYGEGADALLLRTTDALPARRAHPRWAQWLTSRVELPSYEKYLKFRRVVDVDETGEAINNVLEFKELQQDVRWYGSRCTACGTVQFPMTRVCIRCQTRDRLTAHKLQKRGAIFTFTVDHLIANLDHPLPMAVVDLDGGGRVYLQVTDFAADEVRIGAPVVLTYRRLHDGGGNHNYFWKARPVR